MHPLRLTVKNYRCFSDAEPLIIDIGPGFTALVGANNSGKSSLLKLFHELHELFQNIGGSWCRPEELNITPRNIEDWHELFHNQNRRQITIEFEDLNAKEWEIAKWTISCNRERKNFFNNEIQCKIGEHSTARIAKQIDWNRYILEGIAGPQSVNIVKFRDFASSFASALYVGPFRNALTESSGTYYDLEIGTRFISTWNHWKNGPTRESNEAVQAVLEDISRIFEFKRLDVNPSSSNSSFQVLIDGKPFRLRELGAGLAQFIVVFGNLAIRKPSFLLIDEPELNLHPSLQAEFLTSLTSYTTQGVMFATHSVGLARSLAERVYTFQKRGPNATAKPFEQTPNYAEFVGEMSFSSFKEMGYESILLVEGVTEVKAVRQFLRLLHKEHQIVVIPLGGSQLIRGGVTQELAELMRVSNKVAVIIDSERSAHGEALCAERSEFLADCAKLRIKAHAMERRAFENYLTEQAIQSVKGPNCRALGPYQRLRDAPQAWAKHENWRIARAMTKDDILDTDVGAFLQSLG